MTSEALPSPPILELSQVVCRLGTANGFELAIDDFELCCGEAIALSGPSGAGKSTALNILALAVSPALVGRFAMLTREGYQIDIGRLWASGDDDRLTAIRANHQGYVLQQGGLLPYLSVRRNIALSLDIGGRSDPDHVAEIAQRLGIEALLDRSPETLSVGQRQRVAIARALVHRPEILLADEPTASVHPSLADSILQLLRAQAAESGTAVVLSTHDPERASRQGFEIVTLATVESEGGARSRLARPRPGGVPAA